LSDSCEYLWPCRSAKKRAPLRLTSSTIGHQLLNYHEEKEF
jgi:hypothetical protein